MKFLIEFSIKENLRKKCIFFICLITCFLVSLICLVTKSIIKEGSLLFLILGERDSGEIDFTIKPSKDSEFINYTNFEVIMKETNIEEEKKNKTNPYDNSVVRNYYNGYSPYNELYLMLIDTEKEKEIELGRTYPYNKLKEGECLVHKNLIVNETDKFMISISMKTLIKNTLLYNYFDIKNITNESDIYKDLENILSEFDNYVYFTCDIVGNFSDNYRKEKDDDDNLVIMEQEFFFRYIANFIPQEILGYFPDYPEIVKNLKAKEYANLLIINFPKNRLNYYMDDDYENLLLKGVQYMNKIVKKIGSLQNYKVEFPLIKGMEKFKYGTIMLNLILNIILLALFGLSLILIHSLILITTETHSFEFGILRLVGNSKKNVILIIILECLYFSIPAFILSVISGHFILAKINEIIKEELNTDLNISIELSSFIISFILNFLGPILSSIFPIRNILRKNIATSLNTIMNKTQGMKIEVISLQKKEKLSLVIFGLITFIYGASIYYFLPLSLISDNFGMIGGVFLWIIFGILLGFVLLSRNVEHSLQKLLTNGLLFFTNNSNKLFILKNLAAHRLKNKKTSLMFSLSVGVFIMISVGFDLILQSNKNLILMKNGGEISIYKKDGYFTTKEIMNPLMELYDNKLIKSFSFFSLRLESVCLDSNIFLLDYGKTKRILQSILAVNSGFFDASTKLNLAVDKQNKKFKKYTPSEQLYFSELKGKIGISSVFRYNFDLQLNSDIFMQILKNNQKMTFITKPALIIDNAWGLYMSNSPSDYSTRESIISVPFYLELLQKCRNYYSESFRDYLIIKYEDLPIWGINIKPKDKITEKEYDSINTILKKINTEVKISFIINMKKTLDIVANIVFFIFCIISSIVLIFCLFNLTASMTINIYDQKKEIAVFRSLGTKKSNVIFIYIAESFILVLSSSIIGFTIGSIIAYTMALQWGIITKVNVVFNFPMGSMILIISFSILGGILSTYFPAKKMLNISIAELIRSN